MTNGEEGRGIQGIRGGWWEGDVVVVGWVGCIVSCSEQSEP